VDHASHLFAAEVGTILVSVAVVREWKGCAVRMLGSPGGCGVGFANGLAGFANARRDGFAKND
jgi:hypothetical protein